MNNHEKSITNINNKVLSSVYTGIFLIILFLLQVFNVVSLYEDGDIWLTISGILVLSALCFMFCMIGINLGKGLFKKSLFGGLIGGFAGLIVYMASIIGLVILMLSMSV